MTACENAIDPLSENAESYVFINGFLDTAADSQFVRLNGLRPSILSPPRDLEGVQVVSKDLTSGSEIVWTDSTIILDSGDEGTLYAGLFRPEEGHIYDFIVQRPGFEPATARTAMPVEPTIFAEEPTGSKILFTQRIFLNNLNKRPHTQRIRYDVFVPETGQVETVDVEYGNEGSVTPNGWQFEVFLFRDHQVVNFQLGRLTTDPPLGLRRIAVITTVESSEWDTKNDPTNLVLAHGFFGSVGRFDLSWTLSQDTVEQMGFIDQQDLPPSN